MPITVSHQPGAAVVGQSGALAGAGQLAKWWKELTNANQQRELDRQQQTNMQLRSIQAQQESQASAHQNAMEMSDYTAQNQMSLADEAAAQAVQKQFELQQGQQDQWEERYTTAQKTKLAQTSAAEDAVKTAVASGQISEAHGAEMLGNIALEQQGIQKTKFPKEEDNFPPGKGVGAVWSEGGNLMTRDKDGIPKHVAKDETVKNEEAQVKLESERELKLQDKELEMMKQRTKLMEMWDAANKANEAIEEGGQKVSATKIAERYESAIKSIDEMLETSRAERDYLRASPAERAQMGPYPKARRAPAAPPVGMEGAQTNIPPNLPLDEALRGVPMKPVRSDAEALEASKRPGVFVDIRTGRVFKGGPAQDPRTGRMGQGVSNE